MTGSTKACVVGGSGFLGSSLIKMLLEKGYSVNATLRDPGNVKKTSHLTALHELGELKMFAADLTDTGSFDAPVSGCELVFHVASPINFASKDPENDMIKPAIEGVKNVISACAKAKTVKRVILTSSAAAVAINDLSGTGILINESNWTDTKFLALHKPPAWGYLLSKALGEEAAWFAARENNIDLITVIPSIITGEAFTVDVPNCVHLSMALITGDEFQLKLMKDMQMVSGSISLVHVEDLCRAHVFLAEKESARGRYVCSACNITVPELAKFLKARYPHYDIPTEFGEFPSKAKVLLSSEKLIAEGFSFEHQIEDIYDGLIKFFQQKSLIK